MKRYIILFFMTGASLMGFSQGISVGPGAFMTIQNNALVKTTGSAGLAIRSTSLGTGSLIAGAGAVSFLGTGTASAQRYIINDNQWHFIAAPLGAGSQPIWPEFAPTPSLGVFTGDFNWDFYYWNPNCSYATPTDLPWVNLRLDGGDYNDGGVEATGNGAGFGTSTATFEAGRGYLVAYASSWPSTIHTFSGSLHSGTQSRTVTHNTVVEGGNSWNLVGNPYPSSIDWSAASGWSRSQLAESDGGGYDYWVITSSGNYGVCNSGNSTGTHGTTNQIAPMQGFFVEAAITGTFSMDDRVRKHSGQAFLKSVESENGLIRLKLSTTVNPYYDEMILDLRPHAREGGSRKFGAIEAAVPEIWASRNGREYSIVRFGSFSEDLEIPVSVRCGVAGDYTVLAPDLDGFTSSTHVFLDDLQTGMRTDLKVHPSYSFYGTPQDARERFRVSFRYGTGIPGSQAGDVSVRIWAAGRDVWVKSDDPERTDAEIRIADAAGRTVFHRRGLTVTGQQMLTTLPAAGLYIATVITRSGAVPVKVLAR